MAKDAKASLKWLSSALEIEETGNDFYVKALSTCQNETGRQVLDMLRKDELIHMRRIRNIYEAIDKGHGWTEEWKDMKIDHDSIKSLFVSLKAKHADELKAESSDLDALTVGIDLEQKSIKFYKQHMAKAADPLEKSFLEHMIDEEQNHFFALLDMKDFLIDPAAWHFKKEHHLPV